MYLNRFTDVILDRLPRQKWNSLSRFISSLTIPCIGSPIRFRTRGFTLREYDLESTPGVIIEQYFKFCYPPDEIRNRVCIDKHAPDIHSDQRRQKSWDNWFTDRKGETPVSCPDFKNESGDVVATFWTLPAGKQLPLQGEGLTGPNLQLWSLCSLNRVYQDYSGKVDYCLLSYYKENSILEIYMKTHLSPVNIYQAGCVKNGTVVITYNFCV